jgi:predicted RNA-binding protein with PUA domain
MSVFTAYIDESGIHSDASNVVVGGYVSAVRNWKQFRREWVHLLKREGVKSFIE